MKRWQRLKDAARFQAIFDHGQTSANRLLVLKALPNGLEFDRYAFAVGKRVGKAVVRNRIKRRLREGVARIPARAGWDMVFIARQGTASADYRMVMDAAVDALRKARLLREGP